MQTHSNSRDAAKDEYISHSALTFVSYPLGERRLAAADW